MTANMDELRRMLDQTLHDERMLDLEHRNNAWLRLVGFALFTIAEALEPADPTPPAPWPPFDPPLPEPDRVAR